jgi:hypothetical protein
MNKKRTLEERIMLRISLKKDSVFLRNDFEDLGGYDQVGCALRLLTRKGKIAKLGYGVYTKLKKSVLTGKLITCKPLPVLAKEALDKLGVELATSTLTKDYNEGRSTQVPTGRLIGVKGRVSRKLGFEGTYVYYDRTA